MPDDSATDLEFEQATSGLPLVDVILVTFPLLGKKIAAKLIQGYSKSHDHKEQNLDMNIQWLLLGTTSPFTRVPSNRHTPMDPTKVPERQEAEKELIEKSMGRIKGSERVDVARAIIDGVVMQNAQPGSRWIISDPECYDMLGIFVKHMDEQQLSILRTVLKNPEMRKYVNSDKLEELIVGKDAHLKRRVDPDEFWDTFGLEVANKFNY
ncbi:hypothetical protein BB560_006472 [Smittium megazygosporum]|uniref:Uncharacterized protein n=1 Tax=Smittium megazygosporum TaxID=133381 RepID=A0A2T9Y5I7_9FUNG|nr:hypothetical protein BB560_006472 [Smittium megazygosporum]